MGPQEPTILQKELRSCFLCIHLSCLRICMPCLHSASRPSRLTPLVPSLTCLSRKLLGRSMLRSTSARLRPLIAGAKVHSLAWSLAAETSGGSYMRDMPCWYRRTPECMHSKRARFGFKQGPCISVITRYKGQMRAGCRAEQQLTQPPPPPLTGIVLGLAAVLLLPRLLLQGQHDAALVDLRVEGEALARQLLG